MRNPHTALEWPLRVCVKTSGSETIKINIIKINLPYIFQIKSKVLIS